MQGRPANTPDWQLRPWAEQITVDIIPNLCICTWSYHNYVSTTGGTWRLKFRNNLCTDEIHKKGKTNENAR